MPRKKVPTPYYWAWVCGIMFVGVWKKCTVQPYPSLNWTKTKKSHLYKIQQVASFANYISSFFIKSLLHVNFNSFCAREEEFFLTFPAVPKSQLFFLIWIKFWIMVWEYIFCKLLGFSLEFQKIFSIIRTIFSYSSSEQFWKQNTIITAPHRTVTLQPPIPILKKPSLVQK